MDCCGARMRKRKKRLLILPWAEEESVLGPEAEEATATDRFLTSRKVLPWICWGLMIGGLLFFFCRTAPEAILEKRTSGPDKAARGLTAGTLDPDERDFVYRSYEVRRN